MTVSVTRSFGSFTFIGGWFGAESGHTGKSKVKCAQRDEVPEELSVSANYLLSKEEKSKPVFQTT